MDDDREIEQSSPSNPGLHLQDPLEVHIPFPEQE